MVHPSESEVLLNGNGHEEHVHDSANGVAPMPDTYAMVRDVVEEVRGWKAHPPTVPSPEIETAQRDTHEKIDFRDANLQFFHTMNGFRFFTNEEKDDLGKLLDLTRFGAAYHMLRFHSVARTTVDRLKKILAGEGPKERMILNETFGITKSVVRTRREEISALAELLDQNERTQKEDWQQLVANRDEAALKLCGMGVDIYRQGAIAKAFLAMRTKFLAFPQSDNAERDAFLKTECRTEQEMREDIADVDRIRDTQKKVHDALVHGNLKLVVSLAKKHRNQGMDFLELVSEGVLGLQRAIDKFEPKRGYTFLTYATWWVKQFLKRAISIQSELIRIPTHLSGLKTHIRYENENGLSGYAAADIQSVRDSMRVVSLNLPIGLEGKSFLEGTVSDPSTILPEDAAHQGMLVSRVEELLKVLNEDDRKILELYYGLGTKPHSMVEIGTMIGLSRARVQQRHSRAIKRLQNPLRAQYLEQYYLDATSGEDETEK